MYRMSCSPPAPWITEPEPRKSRPLKKPWRDEVEDRRPPTHRRRARGTCTPSWLTVRVGQDLLDVVLRRGRSRRRRCAVKAPMPATTSMAVGACGEDRVGARDQVDAGRHHRRGVDERARPASGPPSRRAARRGAGTARSCRRRRRRAASAIDRRAVALVERPDPLEDLVVVSVPRLTQSMMMPRPKPKSPTRLTMNAFLPARRPRASCTRSR